MDMSKLKTGPEVMTTTRTRTFLPSFYWKENNESKYLVFLSPIQEVPKLAIHFLKAPNGWRTFVCRKNAIFEDESNGECVLCDDFEDKANWKHLALAVEVEPEEKRVDGKRKVVGFELKLDEWEGKDGVTRSAPAFGLVSQAASNFWTPFAAVSSRKSDINEAVWEIVRSGAKKQKVSYQFIDYNGRDTIEEALQQYKEFFPDVLDWIAEHGSQEHYDTELDGYSGSDNEEEEGSGDGETNTAEQEPSPEADDKFAQLVADLQKRKGDEAEASTT